MNSAARPWLAIIDSPDGVRQYFIPPVRAGSYNPTIAVFSSDPKSVSHRARHGIKARAIRPAYVIPDRLGVGSIYGEGSREVSKRYRELLGFRAALEIMGAVWLGLLDAHSAHDDIDTQREIAEALTGPPLAAFAMIEKSGKLGRDLVPKRAADFVRNVLALAHWKAVWSLRNPRKGTMADGSPMPGGIAFKEAAEFLNAICDEAFSDLVERKEWKRFTAQNLQALADRHGLGFGTGV